MQSGSSGRNCICLNRFWLRRNPSPSAGPFNPEGMEARKTLGVCGACHGRIGSGTVFCPRYYAASARGLPDPCGEVATYTLPDGTSLALDAQSAVALHFSPTERRVELLAGRLWVDVQHQDTRPFRVVAVDGVTQDVGTAFFVGQDKNRVDIAVTQGRVLVGKQDAAMQTDLQVGQAAHYLRGGAVMRDPAVDPEDIAAWRYGELVIRNQSVADALRLIARYRRGPTWVWANTAGMDRVDAVLRNDHPDDAILSLINGRGLKLTHLPGNGLLITSGSR